MRILACVLMLAVAGCAGDKARDRILAPTLGLAAQGIESEIDMGLWDAVDEGEITEEERDELDALYEPLFMSTWPEAREWAERGINTIDVSPKIRASAMERLDMYGEAINELR